MKRIGSSILVIILCLSMNLSVLAAPAERMDSNEQINLFHQQIAEVNEYLDQHTKPIDIKEQTIKYDIPLSDGSMATYSLTLTKAKESRTIFDAKIGTWYFDSDLNLPLHGSITVRTTVNITEVPSGPGDIPTFTAYDGTVSAIPSQYCSVTGSSAKTEVVYTNSWYETSGYVGFDISGVAANLYFTQVICFVDNVDNYDKIQCVLNYNF